MIHLSQLRRTYIFTEFERPRKELKSTLNTAANTDHNGWGHEEADCYQSAISKADLRTELERAILNWDIQVSNSIGFDSALSALVTWWTRSICWLLISQTSNVIINTVDFVTLITLSFYEMRTTCIDSLVISFNLFHDTNRCVKHRKPPMSYFLLRWHAKNYCHETWLLWSASPMSTRLIESIYVKVQLKSFIWSRDEPRKQEMSLKKENRLWLRDRPLWRPQLLNLRVLSQQVLFQQPSTFECERYFFNKCFLDEYFISEPSAFLTLTCVGQRGSATASEVSQTEVKRTESGADNESSSSDNERASI